MAFNILEGFHPSGEAPVEQRRADRQRMAAACAVVEEAAPDILVLNEALFCREFAGRTVDYRSLFGFPFQAEALYDGPWGNAILSRYPILGSREMHIYNRGGLVATLDTPGRALMVASYHPHPAREPENKASDFARLAGELSGPAIVCGDFNCISPEDAIDRTQLIAAFRDLSPDPETTVDRFIESGKQVFAALGRLGFADAIPHTERRYTIPTDLINRDKSSGMRIDHVLANAGIEVIGGEVVQNAATNRASDHHPVMVDFRIRSEPFEP